MTETPPELPPPTLFSQLYDASRGPIPLYQRPDSWKDLTPEQAQEVREVLRQAQHDPNTLNDPAVVERLDGQQQEAVLQLLMRSLPYPPDDPSLYRPVELDPELFPPEEMDRLQQGFERLYERNADLADEIMNPTSPTSLPPYTPLPVWDQAFEDWMKEHPEVLRDLADSMAARDQIFGDWLKEHPEVLGNLINAMNDNPALVAQLQEDPALLNRLSTLQGTELQDALEELSRRPEGEDREPTPGEPGTPGPIPGSFWTADGELAFDGVTPEPPGEPTSGDPNAPDLIPYRDYIPFFPMVQDPATGEWRNAEPGEIPELQSGDPNAPGSPQMLSNLFDPSAPGPTLDPDLFNPNAAGPTIDPRLLIESNGPSIDPNLLDPNAPGPTLDPALLDPSAPGPTIHPLLLITKEPSIDPSVLESLFEGDEPIPIEGPTLDPALLDSMSPGPTLDPALLDPMSPGPTLDPALLDPNAPGETIDPNLLDPSAPGPTLDPAQLEHGIAEPSGGFAEPAGVADHGFTDPSLTQEPAPPQPHTPDHGLDDHQPGTW